MMLLSNKSEWKKASPQGRLSVPQSRSSMRELLVSPFALAVQAVVCAIPRGQVMSYKAVAEKAGFSGASRAVGTLLKKNYDPSIPCHRVICSDGRIGAYNRGRGKKLALLLSEGVPIVDGKRFLQEKS